MDGNMTAWHKRPGTKHPILRFAARRYPDWRWREAQRLAMSRRLDLDQATDDPALCAAVVYHSLRAQSDTVAKCGRLAELFAEIDEAKRRHEARDTPRGWEIEARLLARQDDRAIGTTCGVDPAVIAAYERQFFCVRDYLDCPSWVFHRAIGNATPTNVGAVWRSYGYFGGVHVLEALLDHYRAVGCVDYQYVLEPRRRDRRLSEPHALIERALLARLAPVADFREALRTIGRWPLGQRRALTTARTAPQTLAGMLAELWWPEAEQPTHDTMEDPAAERATTEQAPGRMARTVA